LDVLYVAVEDSTLFRHFFGEKQPENISKIIPQIERTVTKSTKYLRVLILAVLFWLLGVEFAEFEFRRADIFHIVEISIFLLLLAFLLVLIELVSRGGKFNPFRKG
jgi:hypothetical protein